MRKYAFIIPLILALALVTSCDRYKYPTTGSEQALKLYKTGEDYRLQLYYRNALKNYLRAFELDSTFAMAAMKSALMYLSFGAKDSGNYYFQKARQLSSQITDVERLIIEYYGANFDSKEKKMSVIADSLIALCPKNFDVRIIDAQEKWRRHQFEEARKSFQKILRDYPNYIIAYNDIGYLYARDGLFQEAVKNLEKYKRRAANQINPYNSLAEIYIAIGRYYEAIRTLEYLVENRHDHLVHNEFMGTTIYIRIATAYRKLGQYQKALDYLAQAEQLFSTNYSLRQIYHYRFSIYRETEQTSRMEQTLASLKTIMPGEKFIYQTAILHIVKNEFNEVLKILDCFKTKGEFCDNSNRESLVTKAAIEGELNLKTGLYREAAEQFKLAADTYDDILNSTELRIKEYISLGNAGDYTAALQGLRQRIKTNPNCPLALVAAAEYYLKSGKMSEAQTYINHFLNLWQNADPDTPLLRRAQSISAELNQ